MEYKSRFIEEYSLNPITKDQDLWKYKEFDDYNIQEAPFLCCCIHLW